MARWVSVPLASAREGVRGGDRAWSCTECGLILGGPDFDRPPASCPRCSVVAGNVVALLPSQGTTPNRLVVLDRRILALIDDYRVAKREHERAGVARDEIAQAGNYDLDGPPSSASTTGDPASAAREQHSAIALADAMLERSSKARRSVTSAPPAERLSRPSHA